MDTIHNSKFKIRNWLALVVVLLLLSACSKPAYKVRVIDTPSQPHLKGTQKPYEVNGRRYQPMQTADGFVEKGIASWYGKDFHGRKTSNGEIYDMYAMTAAHKTLPMNVHLRVTNLNNGRSTVVRINDRGPFVRERIVDLSFSAAKELDIIGPGTAPVQIEVLGYRDEPKGSSTPHYTRPASYEVGPFMIQVGAFTVRENAQRLAADLKARYGSSAVVEGWVAGQRFYRVRVGLYPDMLKAEEALLHFEQNGYRSSFVVAK